MAQKKTSKPSKATLKASAPAEPVKATDVEAANREEVKAQVEQSKREQVEEQSLHEQAVKKQIEENEKAELDRIEKFPEGIDLINAQKEGKPTGEEQTANVGESDGAAANANQTNPGDAKKAAEFQKHKAEGEIDTPNEGPLV